MRAKISGKLAGFGVDYLTVTTTDEARLEPMRKLAFQIAESELAADMFGSPWRASGYEGFRVGHLSYGERYDGSILRLGSETAKLFWAQAFALANNITRIDLQSTFRMTEDPKFVIQRHYKEMQRHTRRLKKGPAVSMLMGHDDSRTVYSGRRASDVFGRIYDKGRESKLDQWANCVRYEVEFKGARARSVADQVAKGTSSLLDVSRCPLVFFTRRGCSCRPLLESMGGPPTFVDMTCSPRPTDVGRSLEWLGNQVRPSIMALEARGYIKEVLSALHLGHVVHPSDHTQQ